MVFCYFGVLTVNLSLMSPPLQPPRPYNLACLRTVFLLSAELQDELFHISFIVGSILIFYPYIHFTKLTEPPEYYTNTFRVSFSFLKICISFWSNIYPFQK